MSKNLYFEESHILKGGSITQKCEYFNNNIRVGSNTCKECVYYGNTNHEEPLKYCSDPYSYSQKPDFESQRGHVLCLQGDIEYENKLQIFRENPWLIYHWPYLINNRDLYLFISIDEENNLHFKKNIHDQDDYCIHKNNNIYRPLGTPWDFVSVFVENIFIYHDKKWDISKIDKLQTNLLIWENCPKHLRGNAKEPAKWPRPRWAK